MKHTTNAQIKGAFTAYQRATARFLHEVYNTWSNAKENAYAYCMGLMLKYHGNTPRIIGANTCTFSLGFIGEIDGRKAFFYITRDYDRYILIDEMEA